MATTPDPVAQAVASAPDARRDVVTFYGYLGAGSQEGAFRLYNEWFTEWLELPPESIVHQLAPSAETRGRSYIWVQRDAAVVRSQAAAAIAFADNGLQDDDEDPFAGKHPRR